MRVGHTFSQLFFFICLSGCVERLSEVKKNELDFSEVPETKNDSNVKVLTKVELGRALFKDENLSRDRTMACATCHDLEEGLIDIRDNGVGGATSLGQDGITLGDRNSPMISYIKFTPEFQFDGVDWRGGLFHDGRAKTMLEQAKGPFLDSSEMQMPSEASVVERVLENDEYVKSFKSIYGTDIFDQTSGAYNAVADAIVAFESTEEMSPFDSAFDNGNLSAQELRGQNIFVSARCINCHSGVGPKPLFTNFTYRNLGLPSNDEVRAINGASNDEGLLLNPFVNDPAQRGRFRVLSLRNVGVTAPYMHNGVFKELKTVVHFYNTRDVPGALNPETGLPWRAAEIPENRVEGIIGDLGLTNAQEDDLVSFLKSLTDSRFDHLQ